MVADDEFENAQEDEAKGAGDALRAAGEHLKDIVEHPRHKQYMSTTSALDFAAERDRVETLRDLTFTVAAQQDELKVARRLIEKLSGALKKKDSDHAAAWGQLKKQNAKLYQFAVKQHALANKYAGMLKLKQTHMPPFCNLQPDGGSNKRQRLEEVAYEQGEDDASTNTFVISPSSSPTVASAAAVDIQQHSDDVVSSAGVSRSQSQSQSLLVDNYPVSDPLPKRVKVVDGAVTLLIRADNRRLEDSTHTSDESLISAADHDDTANANSQPVAEAADNQQEKEVAGDEENISQFSTD